MKAEADASAARLAALITASENGRYPVIMDASTCSVRMQEHLAGRLTLFDFHRSPTTPCCQDCGWSNQSDRATSWLRRAGEQRRRSCSRSQGLRRESRATCQRQLLRHAVTGASSCRNEPTCLHKIHGGCRRIASAVFPATALAKSVHRRNRYPLPVHRVSARRMQ
jgi:hypothetical protein